MSLIINKMSISDALEDAVVDIYLQYSNDCSIEELIEDYKNNHDSPRIRQAIVSLLIKNGFNPDNLIFL